MTMIGLSPPAFVPGESSPFDRGANSAAFGGEGGGGGGIMHCLSAPNALSQYFGTGSGKQ